MRDMRVVGMRQGLHAEIAVKGVTHAVAVRLNGWWHKRTGARGKKGRVFQLT